VPPDRSHAALDSPSIRLSLIRAAALYAALALCPASAAASTQILDYEVDHPWLGKIGTYVNRIERQGSRTTWPPRCALSLSFWGSSCTARTPIGPNPGRTAGLSISTASRRWTARRFRCTARRKAASSSWPRRDGTAVAPADVYPNNPWSCAFVHGTTIFAVNTGTVEPGQVTGGESAALEIDGKSLWTRHYRVESARTHANVWLNQECVPVRMDVVISGTNISLVLTGETDQP
jgi:hypothetical protein